MSFAHHFFTLFPIYLAELFCNAKKVLQDMNVEVIPIRKRKCLLLKLQLIYIYIYMLCYHGGDFDLFALFFPFFFSCPYGKMMNS